MRTRKTSLDVNGDPAVLIAEENQVGPAAYAEFLEKIRNVEFYGTLRNVQTLGDFLVRKIFKQSGENFLFSTAQFAHRIRLQPSALRGAEYRIDETRKDGTRHPNSSGGHLWQRVFELLARFAVCQDALHTLAQQRI